MFLSNNDYDDEKKFVDDLKTSALPKLQKINLLKNYLYIEKGLLYPDTILDFYARDKLGLMYSENELEQKRINYKLQKELMEKQNIKGEQECREIDEKNKMKII